MTTHTLPSAAVQTFAIDPDHSEVGFHVRHLLSRTRGRFARFAGTIALDRQHPEASSIRFEVEAASIDTRQADRDAHLRSGDFFDVERYPLIRFASTAIRALGGEQYAVDGVLSLRGIEQPLTLTVEWFGVAKDPWGNERAGFRTEAVLDRKAFGMVWNAALDNGGFILGDDVTVSIDLEAIAQPAPVA